MRNHLESRFQPAAAAREADYLQLVATVIELLHEGDFFGPPMAASDALQSPVIPAPQWGTKGANEWYEWAQVWQVRKTLMGQLAAVETICRAKQDAYFAAVGGQTV